MFESEPHSSVSTQRKYNSAMTISHIEIIKNLAVVALSCILGPAS